MTMSNHGISYTLSNLDSPPPDVACASCPSAVWHVTKDTESLRVYCKLMFAIIDEWPLICDGNAPGTADE